MHWVRPSSILLQFPKHVTETESTWQKNGDGTIRQKAGAGVTKLFYSCRQKREHEHMIIAAYDDVMTFKYGNCEFENVEFKTWFACRADVLCVKPLNQSSPRQGRQTDRAPVLCMNGVSVLPSIKRSARSKQAAAALLF